MVGVSRVKGGGACLQRCLGGVGEVGGGGGGGGGVAVGVIAGLVRPSRRPVLRLLG